MDRTLAYTAIGIRSYPEWIGNVQALHLALKEIANRAENRGVRVEKFEAIKLAKEITARNRSEPLGRTIFYATVRRSSFPEWLEAVQALHFALGGIGHAMEEFGICVDKYEAMVLAVMIIARMRAGPYQDICMRSGSDLGDYLGNNRFQIFKAQKRLVEWEAVLDGNVTND